MTSSFESLHVKVVEGITKIRLPSNLGSLSSPSLQSLSLVVRNRRVPHSPSLPPPRSRLTSPVWTRQGTDLCRITRSAGGPDTLEFSEGRSSEETGEWRSGPSTGTDRGPEAPGTRRTRGP